MLPLWIIDITNQSERRDAFLRLVQQIEHVLISMPKNCGKDFNNRGFAEYNNIEDGGIASVSATQKENPNSEVECDVKAPRFFSNDSINGEEERKAARNARIVGNYWYYSSYECDDYFNPDDKVFLTDKSAKGYILHKAQELYEFQESLIRDAKKFVMTLRESNVKPYQPINIVVLGDVTEKLSRLVYASIAAILQKEKGRFLSGHVHQGMRIIGMLYVPCNVNAMDVLEREKVLRLFKEIEVQHNIPTMRGYDNIMLYQDVQNRTECSYRRLTESEQAEYLVQCLVNMYLACDINHPLLSGTGSDDIFYFSMGATSIYFDTSVEDKNDANLVATNIVNTFKEAGDMLDTPIEAQLLDKEVYAVDQFIINAANIDFDIMDEEDTKPTQPHPIYDFFSHNLKRLYYEYQLRFYPAQLLHDTLQRMEETTSKELEKMSVKCTTVFKVVEKALPESINKLLAKANKDVGALAFVEEKIREAQEIISKDKGDNLQKAINHGYWSKILDNYAKASAFEDYHDTYIADIKQKNSGAGCNAMKREVLGRLKELLSNEQTLLATIVRSFFLGIIAMMFGLPVLKFLSPEYINFGDVEKYESLWGIFLFMLPALIQLVCHFAYMRKKRNLVKRLKLYYTHDAYARLANRIESEAMSFYNKVLELLEAYLERCKRIRKEVSIINHDSDLKMLCPKSKFNQPLNGGVFDDEPLISQDDIEASVMVINSTRTAVNNITREQYFIMINSHNALFGTLFDGISLTDSRARRFDETIGDYVFIGRDEILKQKEERWTQIKQTFNTALFKCIKDGMLPRAFPTIGDKLIQYSQKDKHGSSILEYMIAYSATNGEFTSQSDTEYVDVKMNRDLEYLIKPYLAYSKPGQVEKYDEIFKRYLFITRWKIFDKIALNRLLPEEDFDIGAREERLYEYEVKAKQRKESEKPGARKNKEYKSVSHPTADDVEVPKIQMLSSILLWSVCPDDNSNEWLKMFDVDNFNVAYEQRSCFREVMNQND